MANDHGHNQSNVLAREQVRSPGVIRDKNQWTFIKNRYHMSLRELQVAILVCRDFDNERVAEALKVKQSTAKTHLRSIYRKTGVSSRLSLLLRFLEDIEKSGQQADRPEHHHL
jgi:DNA-binding CsgD family transcriptional regulator